jgi:hypothetical protein
MRRALLGLMGAALLAVGGWLGWRAWQERRAPPVSSTAVVEPTALDEAPAPTDVTTVDVEQTGADPNQGATPMAQRVAVLGVLNKRNGQSRDVTLKPGQAVRLGDLIVRLRACERTAPWEEQPYTGAFVQVDTLEIDRRWHRSFSGWLFKERPALNVVQHPIYDVWPKSCAMTFPEAGADSIAAATGESARSSAKKSPAAKPSAAPSPSTPDNASASNPE